EEEPQSPSKRLTTLGADERSTTSKRRGLDERRLGQVLHGELDWIVMKALEKDRERRYESASALAADGQRDLGDEPVQACPPSAAYRLTKFARRNKAALTTAGLVVAALLIGTAVSVWQAIEANQARNLAMERMILANQRLDNEKQAREEADEQRQ